MKKSVKPSLNPQAINANNWYYEEKNCVIVVHEVFHNGKYLRTDQIRIPWTMLKRSLQRHAV